MSFIRKFNGKTERSGDPSPVVATYTCPSHGEFDVEVLRDENGEAPDVVRCSLNLDDDPYTDCPECHGQPPPRGQERCGYCKGTSCNECHRLATWTPTPTACRVRRVEAVKGKWEKPERPTYLDTRELAEGMDPDDFAAKRAAIWERKRQEDVMKIKRGFE